MFDSKRIQNRWLIFVFTLILKRKVWLLKDVGFVITKISGGHGGPSRFNNIMVRRISCLSMSLVVVFLSKIVLLTRNFFYV